MKNTEKLTSKDEVSRRMIGKSVFVTTDGGWSGRVVDVVGPENFVVLRGKKNVLVNIFDIRSND